MGSACFGYTIDAEGDDLTFDERDSAPFMPKCVVVDSGFDWKQSTKPLVPWDRTIVYETHVRGYTKRHPAVREGLRGTFAGLAVPEVIKYIKSLGITSIELLPIHAFVNDSLLLDKRLTNYWLQLNRLFRSRSTLLRRSDARRARVRRNGRPLSRRGYRSHSRCGLQPHRRRQRTRRDAELQGHRQRLVLPLDPEQKRYYINDTGTGNTLNMDHPRVVQLVTDSLRYWVQDMHVDGFRFDLGTILAREASGFHNRSGFLQASSQDPVLGTVKLIAEPWDCGPGGYQVGEFPPGWAEWNDKYRDTVRDYWRGKAAARDISPRLYGSADIFDRFGRRPYASVNFIIAHDGFTLHDLVTYNERHNEANGEDNRDGTSDNRSWNCGVEGPTDDATANELRRRQLRNFLATLLLSQGTPMLLAAMNSHARSRATTMRTARTMRSVGSTGPSPVDAPG
jgi:isoamylase